MALTTGLGRTAARIATVAILVTANTFRYDFVGPPADRERARRSVIEQWRRAGAAGPRVREAILIGRNGRLRQDLVARLLRQRDDRRVRLQE